MVAIACLRIFIDMNRGESDPAAMADVVAKITSAYLETRWDWPKRFGRIAPDAFGLVDPSASTIDVNALATLSRDLQKHLFGQSRAGEVSLLALEGGHGDVSWFAKADRETLQGLIAGDIKRDAPCQITRIDRHGVVVLLAFPSPDAEEDPSAGLKLADQIGLEGIYSSARKAFIGHMLTPGCGDNLKSGDALEAALKFGPDEDHPLFLDLALPRLTEVERLIFLPLSFSCLVRPAWRERFCEITSALSPKFRKNRAVTIFGVPRAPSFQSLTAIRQATQEAFAHLDLRISDPQFRVEELPVGLARSVTLNLTQEPRAMRIEMISRFLMAAPRYRQQGVLQAVAGLNQIRDVDLCLNRGAALLMGPAIAPPTLEALPPDQQPLFNTLTAVPKRKASA